MGHVIQQPTVIERHILTKQGELEVTINLNLTITLDSNGAVKLAVSAPKANVDKVSREVPDFDQDEPGNLLDFGKNV